MKNDIEKYFEIYRQKKQEIAAIEENILDISQKAEVAIKLEVEKVESVKKELRYMQRVITTSVETGKDIVEVLLSEPNEDTFQPTIWDHDTSLIPDIQISYDTATAIDDFKYRLNTIIRTLHR